MKAAILACLLAGCLRVTDDSGNQGEPTFGIETRCTTTKTCGLDPIRTTIEIVCSDEATRFEMHDACITEPHAGCALAGCEVTCINTTTPPKVCLKAP